VGSGSLETILERHGDRLRGDAIILADSMNWEIGTPALTTTLRGGVRVVVTVRTLDHSVHSGMYGGAAPDALMALMRLLATMHDDAGNVAVTGLATTEAADLDYDEARFRAESGLLDGVSLIGSGSILSRLWTQPSITTIGINAPSVETASNTLLASASAKISMRVPPTESPAKAFELLKAHLESHAPWGARVEVELDEMGSGFAADAEGPVYELARAAFTDAWGTKPVDIGVGGSIPFVASFAERFPEAAILVTGVEDPDTRAHGANESLHLGEFARTCAAEAIFLARLGTYRA
jgi:acetylornithine deacetylase/succinyl-diaminopimelate desuccinylase-like protein